MAWHGTDKGQSTGGKDTNDTTTLYMGSTSLFSLNALTCYFSTSLNKSATSDGMTSQYGPELRCVKIVRDE